MCYTQANRQYSMISTPLYNGIPLYSSFTRSTALYSMVFLCIPHLQGPQHYIVVFLCIPHLQGTQHYRAWFNGFEEPSTPLLLSSPLNPN